MSKYNPLSERLAAHSEDEWGASFSELESVLGFPLPKAARTGRTWWSNDPEKPHSRAWAAQGWQVGELDHAAERVVFRRGAASAATLVDAAGLTPLATDLSAPADQAAPTGRLHQPEPPRAPDTLPDAAREVQPPAMREAAETASAQMHATRALGATAMITAGVAAVAGIGAVILRRVLRRSK